jgi:hypothetical protein
MRSHLIRSRLDFALLTPIYRGLNIYQLIAIIM